MPLKEKMLTIVQEISNEYSSEFFLPGSRFLDVDNGSYAIYIVENDLRSNVRRFSGSRLEVVFDAQRDFVLVGHFLKFQGVHTRIGYLSKRLVFSFKEDNLYFSDDFDYLYTVDMVLGLVVELHFRLRNYYVRAISMKTKFGNEQNSLLIRSLEDNYLRFQDFKRRASTRQLDAAYKVLRAAMRSRKAET